MGPRTEASKFLFARQPTWQGHCKRLADTDECGRRCWAFPCFIPVWNRIFEEDFGERVRPSIFASEKRRLCNGLTVPGAAA